MKMIYLPLHINWVQCAKGLPTDVPISTHQTLVHTVKQDAAFLTYVEPFQARVCPVLDCAAAVWGHESYPRKGAGLSINSCYLVSSRGACRWILLLLASCFPSFPDYMLSYRNIFNKWETEWYRSSHLTLSRKANKCTSQKSSKQQFLHTAALTSL